MICHGEYSKNCRAGWWLNQPTHLKKYARPSNWNHVPKVRDEDVTTYIWSACFLPGPDTVLFKSMPASKLHECWISNQHHSHLLKWDGRQLPAGREAWALMPRGPYSSLLLKTLKSVKWSACFLPGPDTVLFKSMPASKLHECWISNQHHSHLLKWDGRQLPAGREAWALMPRGPYSSLLLKTLKSVKWSACFLPGPDTVLFKSMPASKLHECWISNQHHSQS